MPGDYSICPPPLSRHPDVVGPADEEAIRGITGQLPAIPALIGRYEATGEIVSALAKTALVPPGVGKTSIAVAAAQKIEEQMKDGVCFVDLAAVDDPELVAPAVAFAMGLNRNPFNVLAGLVETIANIC